MELLAVGMAAKELFKYNRKAFMFDMKLKQEREFQEQDMRIEQFALYREDVRDLVELTVAKMDLYLVAAALLIDKTMMLICKQGEAFPADEEKNVPEWAIALNAVSLASGVFFLLLTLWLAMYASISAQSFGTRLLTQFVRLPTASQEQIAKASAEATQFEAQGAQDLLRVPLLGRTARSGDEVTALGDVAGGGIGVGAAVSSGAPAGGGGAQQGEVGREAAPTEEEEAWNLLPTAMLEHIRLYRKVQLNWQAYDAYARVSLFVGASSLIYSCLYWSLGNFLYAESPRGGKAGALHLNAFPALATAIIFASIQLMLTRLDLRLRRRYLFMIGVLVFASPVATTFGMILYAEIAFAHKEKHVVPGWKPYAMQALAILAHGLHTCVVAMVLYAAWPERDDAYGKEALLPSKFRSTLYLDVFGWLLNPDGPGPNSRRADAADSDEEEEEVIPEAMQGRSRQAPQHGQGGSAQSPGTAPRASLVPRDREINLSPEVRRAAHQLLSPGSPSSTASPRSSVSARRVTAQVAAALQQRVSETQEVRFGGAEALPQEVMADVSSPRATGPTNFTPAGVPTRVSRKTPPPGETPWQAFKMGASVIVCVWTLSTLWALVPLLTGFNHTWDHSVPWNNTTAQGGRQILAQQRPLALGDLTLRAAHSVRRGQPRFDCRTGGVAEPPTGAQPGQAGRSLPIRIGDAACRPTRSTIHGSVGCPENATLASQQCLLALLRRGGRVMTLCRMRPLGGSLEATLVGSLHALEGAPALRSLAVGWRLAAPPSQLPALLPWTELQVIGRLATGALISLRPRGARAAGLLMPELELERGAAAPGERPAAEMGEACCGCSGEERLAIAGEVLLSLAPAQSAAAGTEEGSSGAVAAAAGLRLRAWDLRSGEHESHVLPQDGVWWDADQAIDAVCEMWGP